MKSLALLVLFAVSPLLPKALGQTDFWYFELSTGATLSQELTQEGFNLDPFCYPGHICCPERLGCRNFSADQESGYRWTYRAPADAGGTVRIGVGRAQGRLRVDLSGQLSSQNLEPIFSRIATLDGSPTAAFDPTSGVLSEVNTSLGKLKISSLHASAFLNLFPADRTLHPYLGLGVGIARATVTDVFFEEYFSCVALPCKGDLSSYNSYQDTDLLDLVLLASAHAGFEYSLTHKILVGARF